MVSQVKLSFIVITLQIMTSELVLGLISVLIYRSDFMQRLIKEYLRT